MTDVVKIDASIQRLNQLHPIIRQDALDAYDEAVKITPNGVHPFITETYRSFERSNQLYAQGRTKPGPKVTNAPGGYSWHNFSLAVDFCLLINGKESWKVDDSWLTVVRCFKRKQFVWGGNWIGNLKDYPHLEKRAGLTLAKCRELLRSGKVDKDGFIII